jgi:hypothetical protein
VKSSKITIMEHHGVEANPHFSKEDLALGAIDLYGDYVESSSTVTPAGNSSILSRAVNIVREAAPQIVEVIANNW